MRFTVRVTSAFEREFRRLQRRYRGLPDDIRPFLTRLEDGDFTADDAIPGFANRIYKARIASTDQQRGKSGGFRTVYYLRGDSGEVFLLSIYAKAKREDISADRIRKVLKDLGL